MKRIIRWAVNNSPAVNTVMCGVLVMGFVRPPKPLQRDPLA